MGYIITMFSPALPEKKFACSHFSKFGQEHLTGCRTRHGLFVLLRSGRRWLLFLSPAYVLVLLEPSLAVTNSWVDKCGINGCQYERQRDSVVCISRKPISNVEPVYKASIEQSTDGNRQMQSPRVPRAKSRQLQSLWLPCVASVCSLISPSC